ncbi:tetratricopeptide repeat protein, partial [bacterium]|nr:tetratricopeptide repeat protein [bacterium]
LLVDYKTYLASFGWLFLIAAGLVWVLQKLLKKIPTFSSFLSKQNLLIPIIGIFFAIILGLLTANRNTVWRSGTEFWSNVIKNAPGKARAYNNYGVELSQNKRDYKGSVVYFKKAASMDKNYADPLNNVAVAYSHLGRLDDAIKAMLQSLKIQKYYPEGYNNLASFYIQKGNLDAAEKTLGIALKLRPHYGKAFFNLGRIHLQRKNKEKAWECFRDCCTKADFDVKFGFSIYGQVSMELKKYDDAIFAYSRVLKFDPHDDKARFNYANSCFLSGKFKQAQQAYKIIANNNPKNYKSWYNLAESHFELHEFEPALKAYKKTYHMKAYLPYIQVRMAHCLEKTGKIVEAKKLIEAFLNEEHKGNPAILANLKTKAHQILNQMNKRTRKKTT